MDQTELFMYNQLLLKPMHDLDARGLFSSVTVPDLALTLFLNLQLVRTEKENQPAQFAEAAGVGTTSPEHRKSRATRLDGCPSPTSSGLHFQSGTSCTAGRVLANNLRLQPHAQQAQSAEL